MKAGAPTSIAKLYISPRIDPFIRVGPSGSSLLKHQLIERRWCIDAARVHVNDADQMLA